MILVFIGYETNHIYYIQSETIETRYKSCLFIHKAVSPQTQITIFILSFSAFLTTRESNEINSLSYAMTKCYVLWLCIYVMLSRK